MTFEHWRPPEFVMCNDAHQIMKLNVLFFTMKAYCLCGVKVPFILGVCEYLYTCIGVHCSRFQEGSFTASSQIQFPSTIVLILNWQFLASSE